MRIVFFTTFFLSAVLSAGDFEDAEKLFQQGKFPECDKLIDKVPETGLSPAQKLKLQAMREYIWGNNPDKIAENVKKAQEIAAHHGWLTADLLNHSSLLIRRAEDWKSRGIPEYQELSNVAAKLLAQLKDGGNPEIAIKQAMLQTRNYNLNGEYNEPMKLIRELLRLYYPVRRYDRKKKTSGETALLILLGEQYAGLGAVTRNEREKVNALSNAAKYYLQAFENLPAESAHSQDLSDRLCFCRETLRLLGYNLRLPDRIRPQKSVAVTMIDEMLRARRFHDTVIALETKPDAPMRLRYALALSAIGQTDKAVAAVHELKEIGEPHFLLLAARNSLAAGKKEDAAFFFRRFLEFSPQSPDAPSANQQYAAILMEQKKYVESANVFLRQAKLFPDSRQKEDAFFRAAQCYYQGGNYAECIRIFSRIQPTPEHNLLLAQAMIKNDDMEGALALLNKLFPEKSLSEDMRINVAKLAIFSAMKSNSKEAVRLLKQFLKQYPKDAETPEYARHLLHLYKAESAVPSEFEKLADYFLKNVPGHRDTVAFILACSKKIPDADSKGKLLRRLLMQPDFSIAELNALLKYIPSTSLKRDFLNHFKKPFANTPELCELYFQIAEIEFELKNYQKALMHIENLLRQSEVFQYKECKKLQIEAYIKLGREPDVRKCCQELLLTELTVNEKRSVVFLSAQSWERSGESKKAIASAWTAVPLDGKKTDPKNTRIIRELLKLIVRNAQKIASKTDLQDANQLLCSTRSH